MTKPPSLPRSPSRVALAVGTALVAGALIPTAAHGAGPAYQSQVLADHPLALWPLDETAGSAAGDALGANPGTHVGSPAVGGPSLLRADSGRSAGYDGVDDDTVIASSTRLSPSAALTLEAWVRPRQLPAAGQFASIVSKAESYSLQFDGPALEFTVIQSGARRRLQAPAGTVAVGRAFHVVGTYDGHLQRLYVNGRQVSARGQSGPVTVTRSQVVLGSWDGRYEHLAGSLDEVAVYGSALPAVRVAQHYAAGTATAAPASPPSTPSPAATAATSPAATPSPTTAPTSPTPSTPPGAAAVPGPLGVPGSWRLTYHDEFDGTALDTSSWSTGWLAPGVTKGANGAEQDCYAPEQVSVGGGVLSLTAVARPNVCGGVTQPYTSGMINSNGKRTFTYGTFEARVYTPPVAPGTIANFPAWWATGQNWPATGEIDVMEGLSGRAGYHFHYTGGGPGSTVPGDFTGWHTYSAQWEPGSITYRYDGVQVGQITSGVTSAPLYFVLNNAVSSSIGGPTTVPATMQVDYVRLWQH